jgi:septum site-determining protein MinD
MVKGKALGIISIKGGVGKTSIVANLGTALANEFNKKILVVDANFSAPNLGLHFGLIKPEVTVQDILSEKVGAFDALYEHSSGVHIIPGSLSFKKINPFKLRKKIVALKKHFDIILIDSSPSLNEELLATMLASDELLVVTSPDYVTLSCTLHAVKVAKQKNTPITGIILNRVRGKNFELTPKEIEEMTSVPVISSLSEDSKVIESLSSVTPNTINFPKSNASIQYKKLAASLIDEKYEDPRFFSKLKEFSKLDWIKKFRKEK